MELVLELIIEIFGMFVIEVLARVLGWIGEGIAWLATASARTCRRWFARRQRDRDFPRAIVVPRQDRTTRATGV
jgi:hypothetical protein